LGGILFGFRKKKQEDGQVCPLCQLLNEEDAPTCTRCYYEFTVAAHRQTVSEVTDKESSDLFDSLLDDDEELDEDTPLVDWTSHSFSMDDMTVDVSPYDEDGMVEVDQSISMDHQFDAPQQVARVKGEMAETSEEDYVLTAADAPKNVTKFDTGDGPNLEFTEEEYNTPVVKLVEMTESADIEPVSSASSIPDESDVQDSAPVSQATPSQPVPAVPTIPLAPAVPAIPEIPTIPDVPAIPTIPTVTTPIPQQAGIWPWPQSEEWDDSTIRKMLREAMESAKAGNIDDSKRTLVSLGPHLGGRIDLIFHIGVLLKKFGQDDVMRRMIEAARIQHPDSPDVVKAVQHLLS
tara:strand:+ start:3469 stop:4512 length:1044 start_codon:yes stop_codon:yes gene_type:complete